MRTYKPSSLVAADVARKSAKHRSKFAALSPVINNGDNRRIVKNCSGGYKQSNQRTQILGDKSLKSFEYQLLVTARPN
jgi:hypothetical protein